MTHSTVFNFYKRFPWSYFWYFLFNYLYFSASFFIYNYCFHINSS